MLRDFFGQLFMLESYRQEQEIIMRAELEAELAPGGKYEGLYIDPDIIAYKWKVFGS